MEAQAFKDLRRMFITTPILIHLDFQKPFFLKSDASDFALRAILSQHGEDGRLHPAAFHLEKFIVQQARWGILLSRFNFIITYR